MNLWGQCLDESYDRRFLYLHSRLRILYLVEMQNLLSIIRQLIYQVIGSNKLSLTVYLGNNVFLSCRFGKLSARNNLMQLLLLYCTAGKKIDTKIDTFMGNSYFFPELFIVNLITIAAVLRYTTHR